MSLRTEQLELIGKISRLIIDFLDLNDFNTSATSNDTIVIKNLLKFNIATPIEERLWVLENILKGIEFFVHQNVSTSSYLLSFILGTRIYPDSYQNFYSQNGLKNKLNLHFSRLKKLINLEQNKQDFIDFFLNRSRFCPPIIDKHLCFMIDDFAAYLDEHYPKQQSELNEENGLIITEIPQNIEIQKDFYEQLAEECAKGCMPLSLAKLIDSKKINLFQNITPDVLYGEYLMRLSTATTNSVEILEVLHKNGVSLDSTIPDSTEHFAGFNLFHIACYFGKPKALHYLFSQNAHYKANLEGITPAQILAQGPLSSEEKQQIQKSLIQLSIPQSVKEEFRQLKL